MAMLAFRGDKDKSDIILNVLRKLNGKNIFDIHPTNKNKLYGLGYDLIIREFDKSYDEFKKVIYDIDDFLKKFPYEIYDKVVIAEKDRNNDGTYIVIAKEWDNYYGRILCKLKPVDEDNYREVIGYDMKLTVVHDKDVAKNDKNNVSIKGNKEKGKDIISYLENLGGVNKYKCDGRNELAYYYINTFNNDYIMIHEGIMSDPYVMFTIDELKPNVINE